MRVVDRQASDGGGVTGIREAEPADRASVWELVALDAVSEPRREVFDNSYRAVLADDRMLALVALDYGVVVGYLLAARHESFVNGGPVVWVEDVVVAPDVDGRGVDLQLMDEAENWARDFGARLQSPRSRPVLGADSRRADR